MSEAHAPVWHRHPVTGTPISPFDNVRTRAHLLGHLLDGPQVSPWAVREGSWLVEEVFLVREDLHLAQDPCAAATALQARHLTGQTRWSFTGLEAAVMHTVSHPRTCHPCLSRVLIVRPGVCTLSQIQHRI